MINLASNFLLQVFVPFVPYPKHYAYDYKGHLIVCSWLDLQARELSKQNLRLFGAT